MSPSPDAIILAGGLGTRLSSVLPDQQKVVAPVAGRPFLVHVLDWLERTGINRCILAVGHRSNQTIELLERFKRPHMTILYSVEEKPLGTGGAIKNCYNFIESQEVVVLNGDSILQMSLRPFFDFHKRKNAMLSMVVPSVQNTERYGRVVLNVRDEIVEFVEKSSRTTGAGHINGGVYMFSKDFIKEMRGGSYSFETEVLPAFVKRGLFGFETDSPFIDIGIPEDYMRASAFLRCTGFDNDNKQNPF